VLLLLMLVTGLTRHLSTAPLYYYFMDE